MKFITITSSDKMWQEVRVYAWNCSWRAGKSLAKLMDEDCFSDWERVITVVDDNGKICGFCTVVKKDCIPDLEYFPNIGYVFIDETYRGNRLSQKMLDYAMRYLKNIGFESVYLVSDHENFYEKYGFIVIGRKMAPWGTEQKVFTHMLCDEMTLT